MSDYESKTAVVRHEPRTSRRLPSLFGRDKDDFFSVVDRHFLGFDKMFEEFDKFFGQQETKSYPPYNIAKVKEDGNVYLIEIAAAGFTKDELDVTVEEDQLVIRGSKKSESNDDGYLYKGLAFRNFERRFRVAKDAEVSAELVDGLLKIEVVNPTKPEGDGVKRIDIR